MQSGWQKLTYNMMVAICILLLEYGHFTVKQMYENVSNNVVKITNVLWVSLAILYLAIRIMEDTGSCEGGNVNNYPCLN